MSKYNDVDNTELVELIERGLRTVKDELISLAYFDTNLEKQIKELEQQIKELENEIR